MPSTVVTTKSTRRRKAAPVTPDPRPTLARRLDLLADLHMQHGHHLAAERLSWRAAELREDAR